MAPDPKSSRVAAVAVVLAVLAACGGSGDDDPSGGAATEAGATTTSAPSSADESYQEIEFTGDDGETRAGRLFGGTDADVAVILSHMGSDGDSSNDWTATAEILADEGYLVMTYERLRPRYQVWEDLIGALRYVRDEVGAETVIAGGASIGAMASLHVALAGDPEIDAVFWIAGVLSGNGMSFSQDAVAELACPILVVSGDSDGYNAAPVAEYIAEWAPTAGEPLMLASSAHGTDIFAEGGAAADELESAIVSFVDIVAKQPRTPC